MRCLTPSDQTRAQRGLTLIELMIAITILGILVAAGAPAFRDYLANSRARSAGDAILAETLFAQSEAIKRNGLVRIEVSASGMQVVDQSTGSDVVLRARVLPANVSADVLTMTFNSRGQPSPFGTSYSLNVTPTGPACSSEVRCPVLQVDAGGAARLCASSSLC